MPDDLVLVTDPLEARLLTPDPAQAVRVAVVVPTSGTLGLLAPTALNCAALAAAELNAAGGHAAARRQLGGAGAQVVAERYVPRGGTYDGVRLLAALAGRAGTLAVPALDAVADGTRVTGGRGPFMLHGRHAVQPVYLARADGLDFDVIAGG